MEKYGIDKPDLRNPLIIQDVTELFKDSDFNAFKGKTVKVIVVPEGSNKVENSLIKWENFATSADVGAKGFSLDKNRREWRSCWWNC